MSNKSARKVKPLSVPRELNDILKEAGEAYARAGAFQYEIKVKSDQLAEVNERLLALNNEAHARQQLDAVKKAAEGASNE